MYIYDDVIFKIHLIEKIKFEQMAEILKVRPLVFIVKQDFDNARTTR